MYKKDYVYATDDCISITLILRIRAHPKCQPIKVQNGKNLNNLLSGHLCSPNFRYALVMHPVHLHVILTGTC